MVVGFVSGLFWGQRKSSHSAPPAEAPVCEAAPSDCAELEKFKSSLTGISPEEIRQYLKTQDADQKLRKADEILGKIMQLLVAQVGFRLQKEDLQEFGKIAEKPVDTQPPPAPPSTLPSRPNDNPANARIARRPIMTVQMSNTRSEDQAIRLVAALGSNYSERIQQANVLTSEQIQELNGSYDGTVILDKNQQVQRGSLTVNIRLRRQQITGRWSLEMVNESTKQTSRSSGSGDLTSRFSGNENEIFIETMQKTQFQLVYFPGLDQWIGNYLEGNKGDYRKIGVAIFKRR